eukprot:gene11803-8933_t
MEASDFAPCSGLSTGQSCHVSCNDPYDRSRLQPASVLRDGLLLQCGDDRQFNASGVWCERCAAE